MSFFEKIIPVKELTDQEKQDKENKELLGLYVAPHKKVSRPVEKKDYERVVEDGAKISKLCHIQRGIYPAAFAIAHSQINNKDPLRFFVTYYDSAIINPVIIRHTNALVYDGEGCLSFPDKMPIRVGRWNKLEAEYYEIKNISKVDLTQIDNLEPIKQFAKLSGKEARIFQHEVQHLDGKFIFPI